MPDGATKAGKGARVLGFLVFQLGAGVILDSSADAWGATICACGLAVFVWGLVPFVGGERRHEMMVGESSAEGTPKC